jgi:HPt (histidine-containing phosphotransfer) domain-containing protein
MSETADNQGELSNHCLEPILEESTFSMLLSLTDESDSADFIANLINLFSGVGASVIAEINQATPKRDWEKITRSAHKLKGSSRNLGAKRLGLMCERLEGVMSRCLNGSEDSLAFEVMQLTERLEQEYQMALEQLTSRCQSLGGNTKADSTSS